MWCRAAPYTLRCTPRLAKLSPETPWFLVRPRRCKAWRLRSASTAAGSAAACGASWRTGATSLTTGGVAGLEGRRRGGTWVPSDPAGANKAPESSCLCWASWLVLASRNPSACAGPAQLHASCAGYQHGRRAPCSTAGCSHAHGHAGPLCRQGMRAALLVHSLKRTALMSPTDRPARPLQLQCRCDRAVAAVAGRGGLALDIPARGSVAGPGELGRRGLLRGEDQAGPALAPVQCQLGPHPCGRVATWATDGQAWCGAAWRGNGCH